MSLRMTLTAVIASGCSLARPYPPVSDERGPVACHDSVDGDLDGLLDCADPDCVGECEEETVVACSNGRDDDGDGLVDARDPRCWPLATVALDRSCVGIRGGSTAWPGAELAASTGVIVGTTDIRFPPGLPGFAYGTGVITGDLEGMVVELEIDAAPDRWLEAGVLLDGREGALATGAPDAIGITIVRTPSRMAQPQATIGALRVAFENFDFVEEPTTLIVRMELGRTPGGLLQLANARVNDVELRIPNPADRRLPERWTADTPVRIYARAEEGDVPVGVRVIRVTRPAFDPCERARLRRIFAAVDTGVFVCALAAAGADPDSAASSLEVLRSRDCGASFEHVDTIAMSDFAAVAPLALVSAAALELNATTGEVDLAIGTPNERRLAINSLSTVLIGALAPEDCSLLRLEPSELDLDAVPTLHPDRGPRATALGIRTGRARGTSLWFVDSDADLAATCVGTRGTWACDRMTLELPGVREVDALLGIGVRDLGADVVVTARRYTGELDVLVPASGAAPLVARLVSAPGPPGTFDELGVSFPTLMPFHPDAACGDDGLLFVGGLPAEPTQTEIRTEALPYRFIVPAPM